MKPEKLAGTEERLTPVIFESTEETMKPVHLLSNWLDVAHGWYNPRMVLVAG
jgi:hypothetical protein